MVRAPARRGAQCSCIGCIDLRPALTRINAFRSCFWRTNLLHPTSFQDHCRNSSLITLAWYKYCVLCSWLHLANCATANCCIATFQIVVIQANCSNYWKKMQKLGKVRCSCVTICMNFNDRVLWSRKPFDNTLTQHKIGHTCTLFSKARVCQSLSRIHRTRSPPSIITIIAGASCRSSGAWTPKVLNFRTKI